MRARGLSLGVAFTSNYYRMLVTLLWFGLFAGVPAYRVHAQTVSQLGSQLGRFVVARTSDEKISDAERVGRLKRTIDADDALLREFKTDLDNPEGPYAMAESEFKYLDAQLAQLRKDQQKLRDDGKHEDAAALQAQIEFVDKNWHLSKDRFAVAIEEHKNVVSKIATLEEKLRKDRDEVGRLT